MPFPARTPVSAKFDATIIDTPSALHMIVGFNPNILAPSTIERFGVNLLTIAKEICQHPTLRITSLLEEIDVTEDSRR